MVEYYYSIDNTKLGPFSLEELVKKNLAPDTLIWHENLPEWIRKAELPEFNGKPPLATPPEIPIKTEKSPKTTGSSSGAQNKSLSTSGIIKKYRLVIIWSLFHLLAMVLSYSEIKIFNDTGAPKTEKFWPFVKFTYPYFIPDDNTTYVRFNGFFTQYDWTEFSFYVGSVLFFIVLVQVYKKSS
jgi:hypothetical protein